MVELIGIFFLDSSLFPGTILLLLSFATSIPKTMASTTRANTNAAPTPAIINFLRFKTFTYAGSDVSGELFKSLAVRKKRTTTKYIRLFARTLEFKQFRYIYSMCV